MGEQVIGVWLNFWPDWWLSWCFSTSSHLVWLATCDIGVGRGPGSKSRQFWAICRHRSLKRGLSQSSYLNDWWTLLAIFSIWNSFSEVEVAWAICYGPIFWYRFCLIHLDNSHPHLVFKHAYNRLVSSKIVFDSQLKGSGFEPANFNASCSLMVNRHSLYFALDENVCLWSFCHFTGMQSSRLNESEGELFFDHLSM